MKEFPAAWGAAPNSTEDSALPQSIIANLPCGWGKGSDALYEWIIDNLRCDV